MPLNGSKVKDELEEVAKKEKTTIVDIVNKIKIGKKVMTHDGGYLSLNKRYNMIVLYDSRDKGIDMIDLSLISGGRRKKRRNTKKARRMRRTRRRSTRKN